MENIISNPYLLFLVVITGINIILGLLLGWRYQERAQFTIAFIGSVLLLTLLFVFDAVAFTEEVLFLIKGAVLVFYTIITLLQAQRLKDGWS